MPRVARKDGTNPSPQKRAYYDMDDEVQDNTVHASNNVQVLYNRQKKKPRMVSQLYHKPPLSIPTITAPSATPHGSQPPSQDFSHLIDNDLFLMDEPSTDEPSKRNQGASAKLKPFIECMDELQQHVLNLEYDNSVTNQRCKQCNESKPSTYRCLECRITAGAMCTTCIVDNHHSHPLHHIQHWNGTHFHRISLNSLGFILHLGHGGHQCPSPGRLKDLIFVHVNGVHSQKVQFCGCLGKDAVSQLMMEQWFPGSLKDPSTVFTFQLLKSFHIHIKCSKSSGYDYFRALQQLTDAVMPVDVQDRYRELLLVMRVWRYLTLSRRSGQSHGIDKYIPHRKAGSLAIRCPACPEVGFNISKDTIWNTPEYDTHKNTLFLSIDGNFKLVQKSKLGDPDDTSLNDGNTYFVQNKEYKEYLIKRGENVLEASDMCAKLKAVRQQQVSKFRDTVISGVVAIQCARHGFYVPQGMVDLVKGESYARTDYALASALQHGAADIKTIVVSYDIWCQYHINLKSRMHASFPNMDSIFEHIDGAIPKMHIHGHGEKCQLQYSFQYKTFSGMTYGEAIESSWSEQNHAAGSTKEQNTGHRHESLDDFNGSGWNWWKFICLVLSLRNNHKKYNVLLQESAEWFEMLGKRFPVELVELWKQMECNPPRDEEGNIKSLYQAHGIKVPSQFSPPESSSQSKNVEDTNQKVSEIVSLFNEGMKIERDQHALQHQIAIGNLDVDDLSLQRSKLASEIEQWESNLQVKCPGIRSQLPSKEGAAELTTAELLPIHLPSSLLNNTTTVIENPEFKLFVNIELDIRLRQAYDTIDDLRTAIHSYNVGSKRKLKDVRGIGPNTRADKILQSMQRDKERHAEHYQITYKALVTLGLPKSSELRPLSKTDLWGKDMYGLSQLGDSSKKEPWFWVIGKPMNLSNEKWHVELDRVRWFRAKAALERLKEEVEILEEEFKRTEQSFLQMKSVWLALGANDVQSPGSRCYAFRQAEVYSRLEIFVQECWECARKDCEDLKKHT